MKCLCNVPEADVPSTPKCFSPKSAPFRYLGFVLMCFLCFGSYFCYDNPGALQDKFKIDLNMPASNFLLLYSVYSWPNVILCFIGGFLLDRVFGIRWGTILYSSLTLCGQLLFALGAYVNTYWLMVVGRFIFGCGAGSLSITQNAYAVLWFKGKALNTIFALQLSFVKLGSTANSLSLESIYKRVVSTLNYSGSECIGIVLFVAAMTCVGSMFCALLLGYMDKKADKVTTKNEQKELIKLADLKNFKRSFWLLSLVCVSYYIAIFPFISLGKLHIMTKYQFEPDQANTAISLVYSISAVLSPVIGFLVDKTGKNIIWIIIGIIGTLFAHGLLTFTYVSPYVCTAFLGISYSLVASSFWPMIAIVVPEHQVGTAYGITQSLQSLNIGVMSLVCGWIVDNYGYFELELLFLSWLTMSLVPAILILRSNS